MEGSTLFCPVPHTVPTPLLSSIGGVLIGSSTAFFLVVTGRLLGLSGVCEGVAMLEKENLHWKIALVGGLMIPVQICSVFLPEFLSQHGYNSSWLIFVVSGVVVGFGTRLSNGCTSGHGVCGMARLSIRSIVAVLVFLGTAIATSSILYRVAKITDQDENGQLDDPLQWVFILFVVLSITSVLVPLFIRTQKWKEIVASVFAGFVFSFGLILAGMAQRAKVLNFLLLGSPNWDYSLVLVLGCAVVLCFVLFRIILKLETPLLNDDKHSESTPITEGNFLVPQASESVDSKSYKFQIPTNTTIDLSLVLGSAVFGVGWGMSGMCPGPALLLAVAATKLKWKCNFY